MVRIGLELYSVSEISEFHVNPSESRRDDMSQRSSHQSLAEVKKTGWSNFKFSNKSNESICVTSVDFSF